MRQRRVTTTLLAIGILGIVGYYLLVQLRAGFPKGEVKTGLNRAITKGLLDSSVVGLERFKAIHQHYPQCVGKYFVDSIKTFVQIDEVYVYSDSIDEMGKCIPVRKPVGKKFDYVNASHTYLGAGSAEMTIIYRPLSMDSYALYGVGENCLDDGGRGDDITR